MSIWKRLTRRRQAHELNERDDPADSTPAAGESGDFVGRVSGDEPDTEPTGAEDRAYTPKHRADP